VKKLLGLFLLAVGLLLVTVPLFAHHGTAVYDNTKWTTLTGTLTSFQYVNPHVLVYMDVKGPNGEIQHWTIEHSPPSISSHAGWSRDMAKPGDQVVYQVHAARNGTFVGNGAGSIIVNGKKIPPDAPGGGGDSN
jgi:hypothetical protein